MKILYYVEPWIQFSTPSWKKDYIWWFGDFSKKLLEITDVESHFILNESCANFHQEFDRCQSTFSVIYYQEIINIFSDDKKALNAWQKNLYTPEELCKMSSLIKNKISNFVPDFIFSITPTPFLEKLYPEATLIYRDAMYVREPFPDELTSFDTKGLYDQSSIFFQYNKIKQLEYGSKEKFFISRFRETFLNIDLNSYEIEKEIDYLKSKFRFILLYPLQAENDFNFYIYNDQNNFNFVYQTLNQISPEIAVIVTQHPDHYEINEDAINFLKNKFPNFIYLNSLEHYHSPSQILLKYVDGMLTLSSGLGYFALMNNIPIFTIYKSHISPFSVDIKLNEIYSYLDHKKENLDFGLNDKILFFLLTRYNFSYHYMYESKWLFKRLNFLKENKENLLSNITYLPLIDEPESILNNLEKNKRAFKILK